MRFIDPTFAVVSEKRYREYMEDRHTVDLRVGNADDLVFGGVYDGHGGHEVAAFAAEHMLPAFERKFRLSSALTALRSAYWHVGKQARETFARGGCCAANFFVMYNTIYHANVGDCSIFVVGDEVVELTTVDRTDNKSERRRLAKKGCTFQGPYFFTPENKGIMPTRAFGDAAFKRFGQTDVPHVGRYLIKQTDRFLVACTDGLTDGFSGDEILMFSRMAKTCEEFAEVLKSAVDRCGVEDNLTIIVMNLQRSVRKKRSQRKKGRVSK